MRTFKQIREKLADIATLSHRRLKSIINDPKHPMHSAAKAEHDRRMQKEAAEMAECGCGADCDHCGGKHAMSEAGKDCECCGNKIKAPTSENTVAAMRKKLAKASAGSEKGKAKVTLPKAPWDKEKEQQKEETVNEVSREKLFKYMTKSAADVSKARGDARRQDKRIGGQKRADDKVRAAQGKRDAAHIKVPATEETVNEISIDKLSRYGSAAVKDIEKHRNTVRSALDQPASPKKAKAGLASMQRLTKRSKGSDMYVDKMTGRSKVKPSASTAGKDKQVRTEERKGLWANIHAKRKRGEKPNPPGHPDRPSAEDLKRSQK